MLSTPIKTYQLLFGIVLLEIICHTLFINIGLEEFISMSYLFAGIAIGIMPFLKTKDQSIKWVNQIFDFKFITLIAFSLLINNDCFCYHQKLSRLSKSSIRLHVSRHASYYSNHV